MRRKILNIFLSIAVVFAVLPMAAGSAFAGTADSQPAKVSVELLKAQNSGSYMKLSWTKISSATKYVVYGQKCGKKGWKKLTSTKNSYYTVKSIKGAKLKSHNTYRFYVAAYNGSRQLVKSKNTHFIFKTTSGKYANAKSISVKPAKSTLSKGDTLTLKASTQICYGKKHIKSSHGAAIRYISNCPGVAKVSSKGVVTAVAPGTATIYVQDIGGKYCKSVITVKKDSYTVSFDSNGHGTAPESQYVEDGSKAAEPEEPAETGYTFGGWFRDSECTDEWDFDTDTVTENITLYAKWTKEKYTVSFDMQGHGTNIDKEAVEYGSSAAEPAEPAETGYIFGGWFRDSECTDAWDFDTDTVTKDITLYAKWTEKEYTISIKAGSNGSVDLAKLENVKYRSEIYADGNKLNAGANVVTATPDANYEFDKWTGIPDDGLVTGDVELSASFKIKKYTVSFDLKGHGTAIDKETVEYGSSAAKPADPAATGYIFGGWFRDSECTDAWDFDTDTVKEDITLYAKWTKEKYTVSFDMQGHGKAIEKKVVEYGSKLAAPDEPYELLYTFGGWYKDNGCTSAWNFDKDTVTKDVTIFAKWTPTKKGDLITLYGKKYRVLKINGTTAELLSMDNVNERGIQYSTDSSRSYDTRESMQGYYISNLDKYLNLTWYNSLNSEMKAAIVPQTLTESGCIMSWDMVAPLPGDYRADCAGGQYWIGPRAEIVIGPPEYDKRYVYAPDLIDVIDYLGEGNITAANVNKMFFNTNQMVNDSIWLRSGNTAVHDYAWIVQGNTGGLNVYQVELQADTRAVFTIDLSKCTSAGEK